LEEMNRDVLEQARRQKEEMIGGFMSDLLINLRGLVYENHNRCPGQYREESVHAPKVPRAT